MRSGRSLARPKSRDYVLVLSYPSHTQATDHITYLQLISIEISYSFVAEVRPVPVSKIIAFRPPNNSAQVRSRERVITVIREAAAEAGAAGVAGQAIRQRASQRRRRSKVAPCSRHRRAEQPDADGRVKTDIFYISRIPPARASLTWFLNLLASSVYTLSTGRRDLRCTKDFEKPRSSQSPVCLPGPSITISFVPSSPLPVFLSGCYAPSSFSSSPSPGTPLHTLMTSTALPA